MEPSLIGLMLSLPSHTTTPRTKVWRALRAIGAAVLRDGLYVLPASPNAQQKLSALAREIEAAGGTAELLDLAPRDPQQAARFTALFDRSEEFGPLVTGLKELLADPSADRWVLERALRALRRQFDQLVAIDFFPGEAQRQTRQLLEDAEHMARARLAPDEPRGVERVIPLLARSDYQGRLWATRARPWVDRLASAWLIRRLIDPAAIFMWIKLPGDCPPQALGFDFDGATFTHTSELVTFETLIQSFQLSGPGLNALASLVHCLDVGGVPVPEAAGVAALLDGLRRSLTNDDALLAAAVSVFDALLLHFTPEPA